MFVAFVMFVMLFISCNDKGKKKQPNSFFSIKVNPDTSFVNQKIKNKSGSHLLIFTGWAADPMGGLDTNAFHDEQIRNLLGNADVSIFYVDDRQVSESGSLTIGEINAKYQLDRFGTTTQSYFIWYKDGIQVCTAGESITKRGILRFLKNCSGNF